MTRPARLRYVDSNGDTQIIGELNTQADKGDIDSLQLKNNGSGEYTRVELTGNSNILDKMPVNINDFDNANEPEIFLDVWSTSSDSFVTRDRLFAEKKGDIETDEGDYRNDQLWGFQKWVGRQKVEDLGPINSDVAGVMTEALNSVSGSYTVQTNGTIPSVQNYTFTGRIDSLIRDLIRDYPSVKIWWTPDTSNGNTIVRVEEAGAGSTTETITYPDPNYTLIDYEPDDTSKVVNRVSVIGTDGSGNKISVDTDDFASGQLATDITNSQNKYGERTIERHVGYLEDTSHAEDIAKNLLQLEAQPHLKVALPFQEQNVLNASVDITDDRYGIDGVYKVVNQRDFFKDSRTEVELSFEKNSNEENRGQTRDLYEERARLYPDSQTDVGNQSVDADTENVDDSYDTQANQDHSTDIGGKDSDNDGGATVIQSSGFAESITGVTAGIFETLTTITGLNNDSQGMDVYYNIEVAPDGSPSNYLAQFSIDWDIVVNNTTDSKDIPPDFIKATTHHTKVDTDNDGTPDRYNSANIQGVIRVPENTNGNDYELRARPNEDCAVEVNTTVAVYDEHFHTVQFEADRGLSTSDGATNDTNASDSSAGDTTSLSASGSTEDNVNVNTATEDKTDR